MAQFRARSSVAMDDAGRRQWIAQSQPLELRPVDRAFPRPPRQPFAPKPPRLMDDGDQAVIVAADAKVGEVPLQHLAESTMLLGHRPRPQIATLPVDRLERSCQSIFGGALPHRWV